MSLLADPTSVLPARVSSVLAITDVSVLAMTHPALEHEQTVLVDDGVITAIGPSGQVQPPPGAEVIAGRGRFLMPGLADMHAHLGEPGQAVLFLANGVTRIRNMFGGQFHLDLRDRVERGEIPGPRIFTTSPIVDGPVHPDGRGVYPGNTVISHPDQAPGIIAAIAAAGYDAVKVYSYLSAESLVALGRACRDHGLTMVGHCPSSMSFEEAIDAGMTSMEHFYEVGRGHLRDGVCLPSIDPNNMLETYIERLAAEINHIDTEAVRRLASLMAEREIWNTPTITVNDRINRRGVCTLEDADMMLVPRDLREHWSRRAMASTGAIDPAVKELRVRYQDFLVSMTRIMHEEGGPLLLGTDSGSPMTPQGITIHEELEFFSQAGLSPFEVYATGTTAAARAIGDSDRLGTVEVGKQADLLLLNADPLASVAAVKELEAVFSSGFYLSRATLDSLLEWRLRTADAAADLPPELVGPMATKEWMAR